jgi:hypothetical protein
LAAKPLLAAQVFGFFLRALCHGCEALKKRVGMENIIV